MTITEIKPGQALTWHFQPVGRNPANRVIEINVEVVEVRKSRVLVRINPPFGEAVERSVNPDSLKVRG